MSFFNRLKDFCAINFPAAYESVYRFRHGIHLEDLGETVAVRSKELTEHIRLKNRKDFALKVPPDFSAPPTKLRVAAVVHIFYPELADELKNLLLNIPCKVDVFISTTAPEKKSAIENVFGDFDKGSVTIKIFENRGRDIAAAFVGFREIYDRYDACVHIHSKKSLHAKNRLSGWRNHLYRNLLGSPEIVGGILEILSDARVGLVFPQYFTPIRISVNWGRNYLVTKNFLHRLGIEVDNRNLIEFPAGSMFWFKPKALAPLFDSGLTFDDFPEERGQIDGTIAHAIERAFLFIVEAAGFGWVKVDSDEKFFNMTPILKSHSQEELAANIERARHSVMKKY
ncbi:MAG: hypothetical protein IKO05_08870 [Selenomonadaceae bacterium]|nr:hypothetical protein [Selenomonadaceae bacterium]MBR3499088.1 hypothetical protein [Selenomonadaceae bacterium]